MGGGVSAAINGHRLEHAKHIAALQRGSAGWFEGRGAIAAGDKMARSTGTWHSAHPAAGAAPPAPRRRRCSRGCPSSRGPHAFRRCPSRPERPGCPPQPLSPALRLDDRHPPPPPPPQAQPTTTTTMTRIDWALSARPLRVQHSSSPSPRRRQKPAATLSPVLPCMQRDPVLQQGPGHGLLPRERSSPLLRRRAPLARTGLCQKPVPLRRAGRRR